MIEKLLPVAAAAIVTWLVQAALTATEAEATRLYWQRYVHGVEIQRREWEEGFAPRG